LFALIAAAGTGSRIDPARPKQYAALAGRPMLWHAVRALCVAQVETIFVVLAPDDRHFAAHDWSAFAGKLEPLYCGGETRRDSIYNGLVSAMEAVNADDWILVHDAARPCLPEKDLQSLIRECEGDKIGGILAAPIAETVKRVAKDEGGAVRIERSEDRAQLWVAQTPQMFRAGLLAQALKRAKDRVTDEAQAIEALGLKPRIVAGSRENVKVTYGEDLAIARAILERRAA
jgi:2-C-methyl-D-erythritol 4-phosphate cytidylyltransferase